MVNKLIFAGLLALFSIAQAHAADLDPAPRQRAPKCRCDMSAGQDVFTFTGVVTGAELVLDDKGASVDPRQATIFSVNGAAGLGLKNPVQIWHVTDPDNCGVSFDYGKEYTVIVRKAGKEFETNLCLMKEAPAASDAGTLGGVKFEFASSRR